MLILIQILKREHGLGRGRLLELCLDDRLWRVFVSGRDRLRGWVRVVRVRM